MMKKSTLLDLAMASVINDTQIETMNKIEILNLLMDNRNLEIYREEQDKKNAE